MYFFILLDADLQCKTWPNFSKYGCKDGGDWKLLDRATFGTAECEYLCLQYASDEGCCFVDSDGCYWKEGARVTNDPNDHSLAVACNFVTKS